jgi:hypothetical protein
MVPPEGSVAAPTLRVVTGEGERVTVQEEVVVDIQGVVVAQDTLPAEEEEAAPLWLTDSTTPP